MQKFENVDVIAALGEIMRQNTAFYQSDFDIDKGIIQRAAARDQAVDKTLLWMSRPSIRKQLTDSKQAASPKKAAARTKKKELEV